MRNGKHEFELEIRPEDVYEFALEGLTKKQICKRLDISTSDFKQYCEKHPAVLEQMAQGHKDHIDQIKIEVASPIVEALKKALAQGNIKAIELGVRDILGFNSTPRDYVAPQIGIMPNINFDFSKLPQEQQVQKLNEVKRAKDLLLEADAEILSE